MSADRPTLPWMNVLDTIQAQLDQRLAQAPEAEPSAAEEPAPPSADRALRTLDERLARTQERLDRAERESAETDTLLAEEAEVVRRWSERTGEARRRLADWVGRAV